MKFQNQVLSLHSDAVADDTLMVAKMRGEESMSGLFRFELDLICEDPELDLEAVLYAPARLGIKVAIQLGGDRVASALREVAGVFESFTQSEQGQGWIKYRAVLVPKLWLATRSYRSRIFMAKSVDALVSDVLAADGLEPGLDFEFQLAREGADEDPATRAIYPEREYVVQYEESDWAFLARWLEHEGIFFYSTNEDGAEKVVFADTGAAYARLAANSYPYHPEATGEGAGADGGKEEEIRRFECTQTRLPEHVTVNDYNWRVPSARLLFHEPVREQGTGLQAEYNDHFKDEAQGRVLATARREELTCRSKVFHGAGSCRSFRAGAVFTLDGHFRADFNRGYLLTRVEHEAEQMISLESATVTGVTYSNRFEAIPDDRTWRPERTTAWPTIKGVMHARVDAEGDGRYAELDEHGRYKLVLPFDEHADGAEPGRASRWVRMAQPYAGQNAGMHFPLLKGTEVLVTHIDGDPDRPVIAGAVPNPETESPATAETSTRNAIRTASGNTMQIDDNDDAPGFLFTDATGSYVSDMRRHGTAGAGAGGRANAPSGGSGNAKPPTAADAAAAARRLAERTERLKALRARLPADRSADLPGGGNGMTTEADAKTSGWNAGLSAAWEAFADGDAVTDIRENGRYQYDTDEGLGLSSFDGSLEGGVTGPAEDSTDSLDQDGLETIARYLATVVANLGAGDDFSSKVFPRGSANRVAMDTILGGIHNLTGEAFGSRLRAWIGDDWWLRVGDKYTYADVSNDINIGTGGQSWAEEHGDTKDWSWQWGDSTGYSKHVGNSSSRSITEGDSSGYSYTYGTDTSNTLTFGAGATFALTATARTDTSILLGGVNSNSLFIGLKMNTDMYIAGALNIEIGASYDMNIELKGTRTEVVLAKTTTVEVPDSTKVAIRDMMVCLQENDAILQDMNAVLSNTDTTLADTKACISENTNILQKTGSALSEVRNSLSRTANSVSAQEVAAAASRQAGMFTGLHGLTSL